MENNEETGQPASETFFVFKCAVANFVLPIIEKDVNPLARSLKKYGRCKGISYSDSCTATLTTFPMLDLVYSQGEKLLWLVYRVFFVQST